MTQSADCSGSIAIGQTKTCTVTNNDIAPKLVVKKQVINNNGGSKQSSDFTMTVTGSSPSPSSFAGSSSGTNVTLNAGNYSVSESTVKGYAGSFSSDCSGSDRRRADQDLHGHQRRLHDHDEPHEHRRRDRREDHRFTGRNGA